MDVKAVEERFGFEPGEAQSRSEAYASGEWPSGVNVPVGRHTIYGTRMVSVTYRDTPEEVSAMDERASSLGLGRSEYLRQLVRRDLAEA